MNPSILTEYLMFINHQIISQEKLLEYHLQADSLLKVLLASNLSSHSYLTIHNYLWVLSDIIHEVKDLNEGLLNTLIKVMSLMEPPKGSSGNTSLH